MATCAERIRSVREENNMTVEQFAEKIGADAETVNEWENGESEPGFDMLGRLIAHFDVSIGYLRGTSDQKTLDF